MISRLSSKSINLIVDRFNAVGKRVHLLGIGSYAKLKDSNAWSCDCSSFIQWAASGRAIFLSEVQQKEMALPGFPWVADLLMSFPEGTNEGYGPIFSDSGADRALVC